jgi:hypothetical protein
MPSCIEQKTKKYKSRGSPPYSAMDCKNSTKTGNDGATYTSKADKRGIYRWVKTSPSSPSSKSSNTTRTSKTSKVTTIKTKSTCFKDLHRTSSPFYKYAYKKSIFAPVNVSSFLKCIPPGIVKDIKVKPKHIYEIIDNGGTPFIVFDYGGRVDVYNQHYDAESNQYELQGKIMDSKYLKIFVGDNDLNEPDYDLEKGRGRGNTILLQTAKDSYTYIGDGIRSFTTKDGDIIQKYYSPVGNNAVPYPYAVGQKYVYLMLDDSYIPVEMFDLTKDVYTQYYGFNMDKKEHDLYLEKFKNKSKKYSVKTLFKRFY